MVEQKIKRLFTNVPLFDFYQLTDFGAYASRISQTEPSQDSLSQEVNLDTLVTSPVSTIDLTTTIKTELPSQPPTSIITNM